MGDERALEIKLRIAGKTYNMTIDPRKEEVYRLAEREINRMAAKYEQAHLDGYGAQDYLAIVALQLAISNIRLAQSREIGDENLKQLAELAREVEQHLNRQSAKHPTQGRRDAHEGAEKGVNRCKSAPAEEGGGTGREQERKRNGEESRKRRTTKRTKGAERSNGEKKFRVKVAREIENENFRLQRRYAVFF